MKKQFYLLGSTCIGLAFFLIMFTIIRKFYYGATLVLAEYIFPLIMGTTFGSGMGWWRIQTHEHRESLEKITDELKFSNAELQRKNKEIVETQKKLLHSEKMEAMGILAGGVAHDLNNVLSGIINYPDLIMLDIPNDSHLKKPLQQIKACGEKATAITQDLLTLARRGVQQVQVVNLKQIIEQYLSSPECDKLRSFHPGVIIEAEFKDELMPIEGSSLHLYKTIMNLVSNAAEAIPNSGRVHISLETRHAKCVIGKDKQPIEGNYTILTVSDTGSGIAADDLDRIFEPFFTKKKMGRSGTGLGMAVVWGTVQDHNGHIDVLTELGKGTRFIIYFPATMKINDSSNEEIVLIEKHMSNDELVLIIDDVEDQREIATVIIENLGYRVASVSSGEAAIESLKSNDIGIMLLDMIMAPGISGIETYKRAIKYKPDIKVIMTSGYPETNFFQEFKNLGNVEYLQKPFSKKDLAIKLREVLKQRACL